jgi:hypothetical protein
MKELEFTTGSGSAHRNLFVCLRTAKMEIVTPGLAYPEIKQFFVWMLTELAASGQLPS